MKGGNETFWYFLCSQEEKPGNPAQFGGFALLRRRRWSGEDSRSQVRDGKFLPAAAEPPPAAPRRNA